MESKKWVRDIVDQTYNVFVTATGHTIIIMHSERQHKFLHLQRQCYWDCGYCYEEGMKFLRKEV